MKRNMLLMMDATFCAVRFAGHADTFIDENGVPSENGFSRGYNHNLNIPGKKGHFTCQPLPDSFPVSCGSDGAVIRTSEKITLKRTSIKI